MGEKKPFRHLKPILLTAAYLAGTPSAGLADTGIRWPDEWVVFAPLTRNHPVVDASLLRSVPETLEVPGSPLQPALALVGRRVPVTPGETTELAAWVGPKTGMTAWVFIALESAAEQAATLGLGCDWLMQCWLNGEEFLDTIETGIERSPVGILNHQVKVNLRRGENILAVRLVRGLAGALLAVGDESHFPAERARLAAQRAERGLNILPPTLAERLVFPVAEQATATAGRQIDLSLPAGDPAGGVLVGLKAMPERQVYLNKLGDRRAEMRDTLRQDFAEPVTILLSKSRYPFEDRHLDAIVWTTPPQGTAAAGRLDIRLRDGAGAILARNVISEPSPTGWFFSLGFPAQLAGGEAVLEVSWLDGEREVGSARAPFHVDAPSGVALAGRIPLRVINEPGASIAGAPLTVGVPFPRGALADADRVRLVDEAGAEVPLQVKVTARWSRFGPVKWLLCDFTADLAGGPREFSLEYGPDIRRTQRAPITVAAADAGFPTLDAGRLRVTGAGVEFDAAGTGSFTPVLGPGALRGAFVGHEDGRVFVVPADVAHTLEETGSEKSVVRRTGWYEEEGTGARFCQFVTRLVFHRDSPVARIFHTWIFTGDGNRDRIREMGWRYETAQAPVPEGFLASFESGQWLAGAHLVQHDYQRYNLAGSGEDLPGRTPGVLAATVGGARVYFGARDFWQRFPNELEFDGGGFTFYNWPRHNPPATFERPVTRATAFLHRFAHEGEMLDFRLPDEYAEGEIWQEACSREVHWAEGRPETANAQGIARTEEMVLYFAGAGVSRDAAARVMRGLSDESLRAVADPAWVAASGALGNIHPRDPENYPDDEQVYELVTDAPARWNERLGFYGKWLYGDLPAWVIELHTRNVSLYRAIRKNHHGWPYGWIPYARSGDPRLLRYAAAATRQMTDTNFCHYADEAVEASVAPDYYRKQGWWDRSLLPWAGRSGPLNRNYTVDCDYLWHAYYLTGYARARDVALLFGELTQRDHGAPQGPRTTSSMLPSYLDMYQATWDPWFLLAAHTLAGLHQHLYQRDGLLDRFTRAPRSEFADSNWRTADEYFYRFTGDEEHRRLALNHAIAYSSPNTYGFLHRWDFLPFPYFHQAAFAHEQTGDDFYLARLAGFMDSARRNIYDGEIEYGRGSLVQGATSRGIFTGYYLKHFPVGLAALARAGRRPAPVPDPFHVLGSRVPDQDENIYHFRLPEVVIRKAAAQALTLSLAHRFAVALGSGGELSHYYEILRPGGGEYLSGTWPLDTTLRSVDIEADAPAGDYRLIYGGRIPLPADEADRARVIRNHGWIRLPAADPGIPEVMVFPWTEQGTRVASGRPELQYWFRVPEGMTDFWLEFTGGGRFSRVSVWNPAGERAWDRSYTGEPPGRITISVPPEHAGGVWGASGGEFTVDPRIRPYFSLTREKWFNPEE